MLKAGQSQSRFGTVQVNKQKATRITKFGSTFDKKKSSNDLKLQKKQFL